MRLITTGRTAVTANFSRSRHPSREFAQPSCCCACAPHSGCAAQVLAFQEVNGDAGPDHRCNHRQLKVLRCRVVVEHRRSASFICPRIPGADDRGPEPTPKAEERRKRYHRNGGPSSRDPECSGFLQLSQAKPNEHGELEGQHCRIEEQRASAPPPRLTNYLPNGGNRNERDRCF